MENVAIGQEMPVGMHLKTLGLKLMTFLKKLVWESFSWTLAIVLTIVVGIGQFIGTIVLGGVVLFIQLGIVSVIIGFIVMFLAGRH